MLPIKNNKEEVFVHIDNLVGYIAKQLNLNPKKITLATSQKSVIANESNNFQHKAFEKLIVSFKNQNVELVYDFKEEVLKELIGKNLNVEPQLINLQYFCNIKPGSNGNAELNYIGVKSKTPEIKLNLDTTFNKIEQMRKKYIINNNSHQNNMTM